MSWPTGNAARILVFVTGGGSGFGVKAAVDGTAHIGMGSRPLKQEEQHKLGPHEETLPSQDAVALAVNGQSPLARKAGLTRAEAVKILTGEARTAGLR